MTEPAQPSQRSSRRRQLNPIIQETMCPLIEQRLDDLTKWLKLQLLATYGVDKGERLIDGAKDAAADFLTDRGHTPDIMGKDFDYRAQQILECLFMQNPDLMGPDGTEQSSQSVDWESFPRDGKGGGIAALQRPVGRRRDISKHIQSAFADLPVGSFLSIAEIVRHRSEEYGDDHPAAGAVAARLFPDRDNPEDGMKCTVPGVMGTRIQGKRGASKIKTLK